ncbi:MAG: hypothetical protein HZA78_07280 [Candidatus Schekmanbacteria bacterium]|nr:hypothetical protein [Candidatus Schekmanbacteria bacterium]
MHDLDRTQRESELGLEYSGETGTMGEVFAEALLSEAELYETQHEAELYQELPMSEAEEMELAAELLEITNEAELDRFIPIILGAAKAALPAIGMLGKAIAPLAMKAAAKLVPMAGKAIGGMLKGGGGLGNIASMAGGLLGGGGDAPFERARRMVRFGRLAGNYAAKAPANSNPRTVAKKAISYAANRMNNKKGVMSQARRAQIANARKTVSTVNRTINNDRGVDYTGVGYLNDGRCTTCGNLIASNPIYVKPSPSIPVGVDNRGTWIRYANHIRLLNV